MGISTESIGVYLRLCAVNDHLTGGKWLGRGFCSNIFQHGEFPSDSVIGSSTTPWTFGTFQATNEVWEIAKGPTDALRGFADEIGRYIRCPIPTACETFRDSLSIIETQCKEEDTWRALFMGELIRLLEQEERLSFVSGRTRTIWISVDATLSWLAGVSWKDNQAFRFPTEVIKKLIGRPHYQLVIGEFELAVAAISLLLWGVEDGSHRIIILRTDNINVFQLFESAKSHGEVASKFPRCILRWCIEHQVEVIPRYVRSAHNVSADGLARWSQYECDQWRFDNNIQTIDTHELWDKWEQEWGQWADSPILNTFGIIGPMLGFYKTYRMRVVEWRPHLYVTTRILDEGSIPSAYTEIVNRRASAQLPDAEAEYMGGDSFLFIGTGVTRSELEDPHQTIYDLMPRYAIFLSHGRMGGNWAPEYWSDIFCRYCRLR